MVMKKWDSGNSLTDSLIQECFFIPRNMYSPINIVCAYMAFFAFKNLNMPHMAFVNRLGIGTFSIYLYQCHNASLVYIWKDTFHLLEAASYSVSQFILYSVYAVSAIFIMGLMIDIAYRNAIEDQLFKGDFGVGTFVERKVYELSKRLLC